VRPQPLIAVHDVEASSRWYQRLLGVEGPGGPAHREIWLRDHDGYAVVLASPDGEAAQG